METLRIEGLDRLFAFELKELIENAEPGDAQLQLEERQVEPGKAGTLGEVAAVLSNYGPPMALILVAWLASKKKVDVEIIKQKSNGKTEKLRVRYEQDSPANLLKLIKSFIFE